MTAIPAEHRAGHLSWLRSTAAAPEDDAVRLFYADWLHELGDTLPDAACGRCGGRRYLGAPAPGQPGWIGAPECFACGGSGRVPNGLVSRAEFIRDSVLMGRHTDCPTRLDDVTRGRPVPLRCGGCEYCLARRRCEKFENDWIPGVPHSYMLETSPLDGELPTPGYGVHAVIRRGFVATVRGPLVSLLGGECENCGGFGEFRRRHDNGDGPEGPCPDCGGKWNSGPHDDPDDYWDRGTGRTPGALAGLGAELLAVERAEATDVEPAQREFAPGRLCPGLTLEAADWHSLQWYGGDPDYRRRPFRIPRDLMTEVYSLAPKNQRWHRASERTTNVFFPSLDAARDALSAGILRLARRAAGLEA